MTIAACDDPARIVVTKTIVGDPYSGTPASQSAHLVDGDPVTFAIKVKNTGGDPVEVTITDVFDAVFATPTWTHTDTDGSTDTGSGDISSTVTLAGGESVSWLVEATYTPEACTSLTVNVVTVTLPGTDCCGDLDVSAWAKVFNDTPGAPRVRIDPTLGMAGMEVIRWLIEDIPLVDAVALAAFINNCGNLADLLGGGGLGDGPAIQLQDALGGGTGLYGETSTGF